MADMRMVNGFPVRFIVRIAIQKKYGEKKMKKKKTNKNVGDIKDKRIEWICVAVEEDIDDGVMIDESRYNKFVKEVGFDEYGILDYIDSLETTLKAHESYINDLQKQSDYQVAVINGYESSFREINNRSFFQKLKDLLLNRCSPESKDLNTSTSKNKKGDTNGNKK